MSLMLTSEGSSVLTQFNGFAYHRLLIRIPDKPVLHPSENKKRPPFDDLMQNDLLNQYPDGQPSDEHNRMARPQISRT